MTRKEMRAFTNRLAVRTENLVSVIQYCDLRRVLVMLPFVNCCVERIKGNSLAE